MYVISRIKNSVSTRQYTCMERKHLTNPNVALQPLLKLSLYSIETSLCVHPSIHPSFLNGWKMDVLAGLLAQNSHILPTHSVTLTNALTYACLFFLELLLPLGFFFLKYPKTDCTIHYSALSSVRMSFLRSLKP